MKLAGFQFIVAKLIHFGLNLTHILVFLPHYSFGVHQIGQLQGWVIYVQKDGYYNCYFQLGGGGVVTVFSQDFVHLVLVSALVVVVDFLELLVVLDLFEEFVGVLEFLLKVFAIGVQDVLDVFDYFFLEWVYFL